MAVMIACITIGGKRRDFFSDIAARTKFAFNLAQIVFERTKLVKVLITVGADKFIDRHIKPPDLGVCLTGPVFPRKKPEY